MGNCWSAEETFNSLPPVHGSLPLHNVVETFQIQRQGLQRGAWRKCSRPRWLPGCVVQLRPRSVLYKISFWTCGPLTVPSLPTTPHSSSGRVVGGENYLSHSQLETDVQINTDIAKDQQSFKNSESLVRATLWLSTMPKTVRTRGSPLIKQTAEDSTTLPKQIWRGIPPPSWCSEHPLEPCNPAY